MPISPATGRLRQGNCLNPGGGGCSEPSSCHCTPDWITEGDFVSKKKRERGHRETHRHMQGRSPCGWRQRLEQRSHKLRNTEDGPHHRKLGEWNGTDFPSRPPEEPTHQHLDFRFLAS